MRAVPHDCHVQATYSYRIHTQQSLMPESVRSRGSRQLVPFQVVIMMIVQWRMQRETGHDGVMAGMDGLKIAS